MVIFTLTYVTYCGTQGNSLTHDTIEYNGNIYIDKSTQVWAIVGATVAPNIKHNRIQW